MSSLLPLITFFAVFCIVVFMFNVGLLLIIASTGNALGADGALLLSLNLRLLTNISILYLSGMSLAFPCSMSTQIVDTPRIDVESSPNTLVLTCIITLMPRVAANGFGKDGMTSLCTNLYKLLKLSLLGLSGWCIECR